MNLAIKPNLIRPTYGFSRLTINKSTIKTIHSSVTHPKSSEQLLVVVGGGPAGIFGAIWAKTVAPNLNVVVFDKAQPLSKVKISGGGRCNVTNGHCTDSLSLAENYPRGHKELRGSFFNMYGPVDTMSWFTDHGVRLKTESDGRVFPVSNSSSSIIDCLMAEIKQRGGHSETTSPSPGMVAYIRLPLLCRRREAALVSVQTGKSVSMASTSAAGKFLLKIEKRNSDSTDLEADYLLIATGRSKQGYSLAGQLGHSIVDPVPSLFTFKIKDPNLAELSGVTFSKVKAKLKLENGGRTIPQLTQVGPMLVTHWGLSGPVILRLSAWAARNLYSSGYKGTLFVDFTPDIHIDKLKSILLSHKKSFAKQKLVNLSPSEFGLVKRFWKYLLNREGFTDDILWASVASDALFSIAFLLKQCSFEVEGKGLFKDEFVTAGGVPLSEISMNTMESKLQPNLYFAGEVLNIDGVTGGFNFQNAWTGGYIAGTTIGNLAAASAIIPPEFHQNNSMRS